MAESAAEKASREARERAEQDKNLRKAQVSLTIKEVNQRREERKKQG